MLALPRQEALAAAAADGRKEREREQLEAEKAKLRGALETEEATLRTALEAEEASARKELAQELGYTGDTNDSATMNIWLHKQVMQKLAQNGGRVPPELMN